MVNLPEPLERSPTLYFPGILDLVGELFYNVLFLIPMQICDIVPLVRHWWWGHGGDKSHCY